MIRNGNVGDDLSPSRVITGESNDKAYVINRIPIISPTYNGKVWILPNSPSSKFRGISTSFDGTKVALVDSTNVYISLDNGTSWSTQTICPTPTPTPTQTQTQTPTQTPTQTQTPTPTLDCFYDASFTETITSGASSGQTIFSFNADYMVLTYQFTNGRDLDQRTRIAIPNIGQTTQSTYVGWGVQSQWPQSGTPIIKWGGDNTGTGVESVLIDINRFKVLYPSQTSFIVDLRSFWYGTLGTNPVNVSATLYKGGTMTGPTNFTFNNTTYTSKTQVNSVSKTITSQTQSASTSGQRVATLLYDLTSNIGTFDNNDTTTPSV
jgi:hypothetical protein